MSAPEIILAHHRRPHHRGVLATPDGIATRHNPLCGESLTVTVTVDGDRIREVEFDGESCSIGRASASMMTDLVVGRTHDEVETLTARVRSLVAGDPAAANDEALGDLRALAEIRRTPARATCALLPWNALLEALVNALADARS
jgi:nitrogen fixation protein NifU and related proteins